MHRAVDHSVRIPNLDPHTSIKVVDETVPTMPVMSPATENRLLLLGIGITAIGSIGVLRRMLIHYRDTAKEPKPRAKTQFITQNTEDSLKPATLAKLIESHNYLIFETATRIVCDRALHDEATIEAILHEITRPHHDRRERGLRVLLMLCNKREYAYNIFIWV